VKALRFWLETAGKYGWALIIDSVPDETKLLPLI